MSDAARLAEYEAVLVAVREWASQQRDVKGVAVVGSWARGAARRNSDIDLVILTDRRQRYLEGGDWIAQACGQKADLVRTQEWGALTERRVRISSGLEIEFGFTAPSWAATDPIDPGTAEVIRGGCAPILDENALFERLIAAV
jgi:uncharacterized protein